MGKQKMIYNAKIVTPQSVIEKGTIIIEDDQIMALDTGIPRQPTDEDVDVNGNWVIPGFVDSHSDAIEMELAPRPTSIFPMDISFYELEKKLVGEGVTTIYHSLSLVEENAKMWSRQNNTVFGIIEDIKRLSNGQHLIRHKTHLRYEITNTEAVEHVKTLMRDKKIDELSFMDHTPGQGQYRDIELHRKFLIEHRRFSEEEADEKINKIDTKLEASQLQELADFAHELNIPVASHDDDTQEKLMLMQELRASISEFPIELDIAEKAKGLGMLVVMGAPNVLLGRSHGNNLSALEAIRAGAVEILCSDYYPSSLLHAVFKLYRENMPMHQAVNMVTINPARALKIDHEVGSIEPGKKADFLIIREDGQRPVLESVYVNGKVVCQMSYQASEVAVG